MRLSVLELLHARQQAVLGTRMPQGPRQRRAGDTQPRLLHSSPPQSFPWSPASAPPIHCTQCGPLRSPELLINRELQTQHRFIQTAQTAQGREKSHDTPRARQHPHPSPAAAVTAWACRGQLFSWSCRSLQGTKRNWEASGSRRRRLFPGQHPNQVHSHLQRPTFTEPCITGSHHISIAEPEDFWPQELKVVNCSGVFLLMGHPSPVLLPTPQPVCSLSPQKMGCTEAGPRL